MKTYQFPELTEAQLLEVVTLKEEDSLNYPWVDVSDISISADEQSTISIIKARLSRDRILLMNETTVWVRAIYPLLLLAERGLIQAWTEVALSATFADITLSGTVDSVLARVVAGVVRLPYFVMLDAKRAVENKSPRIQLYGQLLVAAKLNWQTKPDSPEMQEIYGCYTVGDMWTFVRATVQGLDKETEKPLMTVETSQEFIERVEAETILKILKKIVALYET
ncbi:MAG: hypothetical protein AAF639_29310 [Chloroflexota bacterium]